MYRPVARLLAIAALAVATVGLTVPAQAATLTVAQYEAQIASAVNQARGAAGLPALTVSASVSAVARSWSATMASSGSFVHNPSYATQMPDGLSRASENIAYGWTSSGQYPAASIHANLMKSSGHRANILRPESTHLGVGVAFVSSGGRNYVYLTENFGTYPPGASLDGPSAGADLPFEQIVLSPDATGDGYGDAFMVDSAGRLFLYAGQRSGGLKAYRSYGLGWGALGVHAPGDWNGDGRADLVATTPAGALMLYRGDGAGGLSSASQIGNGWTGFRIVPAGDVSGDRVPDLLAIDPSGDLWLYPGNGRGGFGARLKVGNGWTGVDLYAGGDMNRDGRPDILGIDAAGRLWYYAGRGGGVFGQRVQVGNGWGTFDLSSGADINKDGIGDLVGRDSVGGVWFYAGKPGGGFQTKVRIGSGW